MYTCIYNDAMLFPDQYGRIQNLMAMTNDIHINEVLMCSWKTLGADSVPDIFSASSNWLSVA